MTPDFLQKIQELQQRGTSYVVVTMASLRGHAPQEIGAKALFTEQGLEWGTIGGGKLEAKVTALATERLGACGTGSADGGDGSCGLGAGAPKCELLQWNLQRDVGMTCGGEVTLLLETFLRPSWNITVFGAGHVAQALVRVLAKLPCEVQVFDTRADWLSKLPIAPNVRAVLSTDLVSDVAGIKAGAFLVVMTQGHATDLPILTAALRRGDQFGYLGVLGSPVKAGKIRTELAGAGIAPSKIEGLHCPIGLPLGNNTPEEIAISVVAQLLQARDRR